MGGSLDEIYAAGARVGALLTDKGQTVAVAESSAGGLVSAALLAVPGASAYFLGGGIIYTREARRVLLGLPDDQTRMRGATEEYAQLVARTIREKLETTWGLSESGATGPTGNRYGNDAGHACFALAGLVERAITLETGIPDRAENMARFAIAALEFLEAALKEG
ncbi:MAG TPA: CinA family protein [Alphaproteobacteria bacterium]|nr:CinA family protein [Alphaproteobacteria bacterium]